MPDPRVAAFFAEYERAGESLDLDRLRSLYEDPFMFADPSGVRSIPVAALLAALPARREFFRSVGHQSTRVGSLDETPLDANYILVRAVFRMRFHRPPAEQADIELGSTFILHLRPHGSRIVFHLEHQDLRHALQGRGLLETQK